MFTLPTTQTRTMAPTLVPSDLSNAKGRFFCANCFMANAIYLDLLALVCCVITAPIERNAVDGGRNNRTGNGHRDGAVSIDPAAGAPAADMAPLPVRNPVQDLGGDAAFGHPRRGGDRSHRRDIRA